MRVPFRVLNIRVPYFIGDRPKKGSYFRELPISVPEWLPTHFRWLLVLIIG